MNATTMALIRKTIKEKREFIALLEIALKSDQLRDRKHILREKVGVEFCLGELLKNLERE